MVEVLLVPGDDIDRVWPLAEPFLRKADRYMHGELSMEDVYDCLEDRQMQLWMVAKDGRFIAAVITMIETGMQLKILRGILLGGTGIREWAAPCIEALEEFARMYECDRIYFCGRPGFEKILGEAFAPLYTTYARSVSYGRR